MDEHKRAFAKCIAPISAASGRNWSFERILVWYNALHDLPLKSLARAVGRWVATDTRGFDPTPGKIRDLAKEDERGVLLDFDEAWKVRCDAVKRIGYWYDRIPDARKFCGPEVWAAIEGSGGWEFHCNVTQDQKATLQAQFRMAYEQVAKRAREKRVVPEELQPKKIGGHSEIIKGLAQQMGIKEKKPNIEGSGAKNG